MHARFIPLSFAPRTIGQLVEGEARKSGKSGPQCKVAAQAIRPHYPPPHGYTTWGRLVGAGLLGGFRNLGWLGSLTTLTTLLDTI